MPPVEQDKDGPHVAFQDKDSAEVEIEEQEEAAEEIAPLTTPAGLRGPETGGAHTVENGDEGMDRYPLYNERVSRFPIVTSPGLTSSPSFGGLSSRPSMASLRSGISRVNSELYPERGSFLALSLTQSVAELPELARKMYILTQILAAVSVSIGSMAVGFSAGYTSPALASMTSGDSTNYNGTVVDNSTGFNVTMNSAKNSFNVTEEVKSWIGSLMPLSALTGSIIGGYLIDALGRKMVILLCGPPFILAWILIGSAVNLWMIYVGRAIGGFCVGLLTLTLPVYLGETIQPEIRGILGLLPTTIGNGGILVCYLVGSYVNWWVLAYVGALIPIVFTFMMCFVPETPRWYISKERVEDAEKSLQWLRGSATDVEYELGAIRENYELAKQESPSFRDIFSKQYIRPFLLSMGLMLFQQLSGINAVIFYTVDIFQMSGSSISGHLSTIIVGVVNLMSTLVANAVIDKLGRKILLYASSGLMVVSLVALGSFFYVKSYAENFRVAEGNAELQDTVKNLSWLPSSSENFTTPEEEYAEWQETVKNLSWLPLVSFMVYVIAFSLGWGPIPWLFMGEALPAKIRGPAASLVTALNWSCTFIITKTFPGLLKAIGPSNVFFLFTAIMVLGSFYTIFLVPETRGKTLEAIEEELSGRKTARNRKISTTSGLYMK